MAKLYDPECLKLAQYFYPHAPDEILDDIASDLQDLIEDYVDWPLTNGETLQEREDRIATGTRCSCGRPDCPGACMASLSVQPTGDA